MNVGSVQYAGSSAAYQTTSRDGAQSADFQAMLEQRLAKMEEAVNSGDMDVAKLQEILQERFGDSVNEAFGEDGSVDFEKLEEILSEVGAAEQGPPPGPPPEMSGMPPGPPPGPPPSGDSSESQTGSTDLESKLIEVFGEAAEGIVQEDGEVDMDQLAELIEQYQGASLDGSYSQYGTATTASSASWMSAMFVNLSA